MQSVDRWMDGAIVRGAKRFARADIAQAAAWRKDGAKRTCWLLGSPMTPSQEVGLLVHLKFDNVDEIFFCLENHEK